MLKTLGFGVVCLRFPCKQRTAIQNVRSCGSGDTVLSRTGFGDDPSLSHS